MPLPGPDVPQRKLRVFAAGDIHCREATREQTLEALASAEAEADLILLAGDLTSHGTAQEAEILAEAARRAETPIFAVLGNHDCHADQAEEIIALLREAGVGLLDA